MMNKRLEHWLFRLFTLQTLSVISLYCTSVLPVSMAHAQTPPNGSFENGLTNWTLGGAGRVDSLTAANMNNQITPTDGVRMAFLSSGPGNVGGPTGLIDGNGLTDFNITTLSTTLNFNVFPAVIKFDWSFPSAEDDQAFNFDDIFDVLAGGTRILSGSTNKPGGASNFPDAPASTGAGVVVGGGGVTNGTNLRFGIPAFTNFCAAIPGAIPGANNVNLQFRVADQADTAFDSGLILDNVQVATNCADPGVIALRQITLSSNSQAEGKNGAVVVRLAQNRVPDISSNGNEMAFIANADYGGGNPFLLEQVFLYTGGAFQRLTNFTGDEVQAVGISADGDWVAAAGRATPTDNLEIYRINTNSGAITQITNTSGCDNTSPAINGNGRRTSFLSTCGSDLGAGFNADGNREMVVWNNGNFVLNESTGCQSFRPAVSSNNQGRITSFASNCDYLATNGDGNIEIFRLDRIGNAMQQITNTTGANNVLDAVDINLNGRYTVYLAQDAGGRHVVFRHDNNSGASTFQGVSRPDRLIINVRIIKTNDGDDIAFEALDLLAIPPAPIALIGHIDVQSQVVTEGAANDTTLGMGLSRIGGVPHIYFSTASDLVGQNGDANPEIFEGRVE